MRDVRSLFFLDESTGYDYQASLANQMDNSFFSSYLYQ